MKKQQFNPEEYTKLKHRVEALQLRVKLDFGPEQETAKRLLAKVEKKLMIFLSNIQKIIVQLPVLTLRIHFGIKKHIAIVVNHIIMKMNGIQTKILNGMFILKMTKITMRILGQR